MHSSDFLQHDTKSDTLVKNNLNNQNLMNAPKAILFDLDGVLIDSEPLHGQAWKETSAFFNLKLSPKQLHLLQGRRRLDCAEKIVEWIKSPITAKEVLKIHKPISKKLIKKAKAMPGSKSLISWCYSNNLPTALVTSSSKESYKLKSAPHEWLKSFSTIIVGDDQELSQGKPFPDPYLLAAKKLRINPTECWAVEDSISGATSALKAGCLVWLLGVKGERSIKNSIKFSTGNLIEISSLNEVLRELKKRFLLIQPT